MEKLKRLLSSYTAINTNSSTPTSISYASILISILLISVGIHIRTYSSPRGSSSLTHFISTYYTYIRCICTLIVSTCITFTNKTYNYPYITQISKQISTQIIKSILNPCVLYLHLPPTFQNLIPPSIHIHIHSIINLLINYTTIATSTHILLLITAKLGSYITGKTSVSDPGPPLSVSVQMRLGSWSTGVPYDYSGWSYIPSGDSHEHTVKGMEGRLKELGVEQEGLITGEVRGEGRGKDRSYE